MIGSHKINPDIVQALQASWRPETAAAGFGDASGRKNSACGQCLVTALVVWGLYGGRLVTGHTDKGEWHFCNRIGDDTVDLTWRQFDRKTVFIPADPIRERTLFQTAFKDATLYKRLMTLVHGMENNGFPAGVLKPDMILRDFKLSHKNIFRENPPQALRLVHG